LRQLLLRDAYKNSEPGFRREQIVVRRIAAALGHVVADREQVTLFIVEKAIFQLCKGARLRDQILDRCNALARALRAVANRPSLPSTESSVDAISVSERTRPSSC